MKLFLLSLFSVALTAAQEVEKAVPDVVTDESGYRSRLLDNSYKDGSSRGGYASQEGYSDRLNDRDRNRYPQLGTYGYGAPVQILNDRDKNPTVEQILGYDGDKGRGGYNRDLGLEYVEGHQGYHGYEDDHKNRFPDYKYRTYGREGLGFDKRTAYALGLRYPLTPKLLTTLYRRNYYVDKQNMLGKIVLR